MKTLIRLAAAVSFSVLIALSVNAVEYTVSKASGDLAASSTWDNESTPGETGAAKMKTWNGIYTLSANMSIGSMRIDAGNVTFDFREGNHTLTLTTPVNPYGVPTLFRYTEFPENRNWTMLRGGTWECGGQEFDIVNLGFGGPYTFILTNGCHLSNIDRSYLFRRISNSRIYVVGSKITARELNFGDGSLGTNDIIEVSGNSQIELSGDFVGQSSSAAQGGNVLSVKDVGSKLTCNYLYLGYNGYGGFGLRVSNGATVTADYPMFCQNAENCFVEVSEGGSFEPGCYDWKGSHCYTLVSNATLNVRWPRFSLGSSGGHHNRLTITGMSASFINPMWGTDFVGGNSHDNVFEVLDGAVLSPGRSIHLATTTNNLIRVSGTGSNLSLVGLTAQSSRRLFEFGSESAVGNVLDVLDGGCLEANGLWVYGMESKIVVSNGTLRVGGYTVSSSDYGIWLGRGSSQGCSLVLKGTSPKVELVVPDSTATVESLIMTGRSVLRYEIPAQGYPSGHVPIVQKDLNPTSGRLEIECTDWANVKGEAKSELVLFRGSVPLGSMVSDWIAQQDLGLPENVKCFVRGTDIVLRRRGDIGMVIMFR